jgi:hypothetical protein
MMNHTNDPKTVVIRSKFLLRFILNGLSCSLIMLSILACNATFPKEVYITSKNLTGISRVAILTSSNSVDVTYSLTESGLRLHRLFLGPLFWGIEDGARSNIDSEHAQEISKRIDIAIIENKMAEYFTGFIITANSFKTVDHIKNKIQDEQLLMNKGYDAVMRLTVSEMSLEREAGDQLGFHIVKGQLKHLKSDKIVWDREEIIKSSELYPLEYYKENGLKELDLLLKKASQKLSYDFIYLK